MGPSVTGGLDQGGEGVAATAGGLVVEAEEVGTRRFLSQFTDAILGAAGEVERP